MKGRPNVNESIQIPALHVQVTRARLNISDISTYML